MTPLFIEKQHIVDNGGYDNFESIRINQPKLYKKLGFEWEISSMPRKD